MQLLLYVSTSVGNQWEYMSGEKYEVSGIMITDVGVSYNSGVVPGLRGDGVKVDFLRLRLRMHVFYLVVVAVRYLQ